MKQLLAVFLIACLTPGCLVTTHLYKEEAKLKVSATNESIMVGADISDLPGFMDTFRDKPVPAWIETIIWTVLTGLLVYDQFIDDGSSKRDDQVVGGERPLSDESRFLLEEKEDASDGGIFGQTEGELNQVQIIGNENTVIFKSGI